VLSNLGLKIKAHWKGHRPKMAKELEEAGQLDERVQAAEQFTLDSDADAIRSGLNPDQARELTREMWALLPTEEDVPELGSCPRDERPKSEN
jgi:hypothetical protein